MKRKILLISLLLAGCSLSKPSFCFENDPSKVYLLQNGDINGLEYEDLESYGNLGRLSTAEDVKFIIDSGNQALIYLFGYSCPSCKNFLPILKEFEIDSKIEIHCFNKDDQINYFQELINYYPNGNYASVFSGLYSPSLFLLKSALTAEQIELSDIGSATQLENRIADIANVTNISTFRTFSGFNNYFSNNPGLLFIYNSANNQSNTFYDDNLISYAKISSNSTAIIDWQNLSGTDQQNFKTMFSLQDDFEVILTYNKKGVIVNKYSYISETNLAIDLVRSSL